MKAAGLDLATTYEAIKISSGTSFVHETESQVILNGSRDINFTMDLVKKDIGLRAQSDDIIRRLEEATGLDITAPGFPAEMTDDEPEEPGYEVTPIRT